MPTAEFIQVIIVAAIAGYVGYLLGRASAGSAIRRGEAPSPLPGPEAPGDDPLRERRSSQMPPPAGAGGSSPSPAQRTTPRRSSTPPPAAAGLLNRKDE